MFQSSRRPEASSLLTATAVPVTEPVQSTPLQYCICLISLLILSSHPGFRLQRGIVPSGLMTKILCTLLTTPCVLHVPLTQVELPQSPCRVSESHLRVGPRPPVAPQVH